MRRTKTTHMTRGGGVHTVPTGKGGGWVNVMPGKILSLHVTKADAITAGRAYAQRERVEHTIHDRNGRIAEKNSYGNDPRRVRDGR